MPQARVLLLRVRIACVLAATLLAAGWARGADPAPAAPVDFAAVKAEADQGIPAALTALGSIYASGQGVPRDYAKALQYYRQAADARDPLAQYNLGLMYESGNGVTADIKTAFGFYLQAAKQGVPQAQFNVANMYASGQGVAADPFESVLWYRQAAEKGLPEAQFNLARSYELGQGVGKDLDQAKVWYHAADAQGFAKAHARLAELDKPAAAMTAALPIAPSAADDRLAALQAELADMRTENAHALESLRAEKAALELKLQVANDAMRDSLSAPAASSLEDRIRALQADNASLNGEVKASIIQLSKLSSELAAAQRALDKQNASAAPPIPAAPDTSAADAKIAELTQALTAARAKAQALADDKAKLETQISTAAARPPPAPADDAEVRQLHQEAAQRQQDLTAARQEAEQLRIKLKTAGDQYDVQAKALAAQLEAAKRDLAAAAQKAQDAAAAQSEVAQLRADLKAANERLAAAQKQLASPSAQPGSEDLTAAASASQAMAARLAAQIDAESRVIADLNERNSSLQRSLDAMKAPTAEGSVHGAGAPPAGP